jgi:GNAT superfamily N-acetyltransferase
MLRDVTVTELRNAEYASISDEDCSALNAFENAMLAEKFPDDPPRAVEQTTAMLRGMPDHYAVNDFWVRDPSGDVVANGYGWWVKDVPENRHLVRAQLEVRPDRRRQGIGRLLVERLVGAAESDGRTVIQAMTHDRASAGEVFARRVGAEPKSATHTNRLLVSDLDVQLMRTWVDEGPKRADGYSLLWFDDRCPDDLLDAMADLMHVMETAPTDGLDIEGDKKTPEWIRKMEAWLKAEETERWVVIARHDATGELAGYTEVMWTRHRPLTVQQGDTGVWPKHRGHALGKWLKAAMALRVLEERPGIKDIRTGNADSNAPMLGINHAMGFKPYMAALWWNLNVDRAKDYLAGGSST